MRNLRNIWKVLFICLKYSDSSILPDPSRFKEVSTFLRKQALFPSRNQQEIIVGAFLLNDSRAEANDVLTEWLFDLKNGTIPGIEIMTKYPKGRKMPSFTDTIVFLDHIDKNINATVSTFLNEWYPEKIWFRDSRYIFIQSRIFHDSVASLKYLVKLLWIDIKLLNFVFICILDSLPDVQALGYNPFKDEFQTFSSQQLYAFQDFFPNKMNNLCGQSINIAYTVLPPFVTELDGKIGGSDYDFTRTFLRTINASIKEIKHDSFEKIIADIYRGRVDMVGMGFFLSEGYVNSIGYPHAFVDVMAYVQKAKPVSAFTTILYIFDKDIWISIIVIGISYRAVKLTWLGLYSSTLEKHKPDTGIKILVFVISIFNIIMTQTFQSWITTFLIYPKQGKDINTVDELVESNMPVYSIGLWTILLTDKLRNQYVFFNDTLPWPHSDAIPIKEAYVVSSDLITSYNMSQKYHYLHQVKEYVGNAYSVYYLSPFTPYKNILKNFTFISLAYGYTSKHWGFYHPAVTENTHLTQKLQLNHVVGIFHFWVVGLALSTSAFAMELLWFRYAISMKVLKFMK